MRAHVSHEERQVERGLIFKKRSTLFCVILRVELSEQERAVIDQRRLWDTVLLTYPNPLLNSDLDDVQRDEIKLSEAPILGPFDEGLPSTFRVTVRDVCFPNLFIRYFTTPGEAKNWASDLRPRLTVLKDMIDYNQTGGNTETFEL